MIDSQQPFRVHQFHYSVSSHDGISSQMFFIQSALKERGISGSIFGAELNGLNQSRAQKFASEKIWDCDLLLVHHSLGNPAIEEISRIEIPKILVYHNIVPAKFFYHDPKMAEMIRLGKQQLNHLRKHIITSFAGSEFALNELKNHHFPHSELLPITDVNPNTKKSDFKKAKTSKDKPKNILFVGKISPHKNQAQLIHVFYNLKKSLPKKSKLVLVGSQDPIYTEYLKLLIQQLGLTQDVKLTGVISDKSLEQTYQDADALVCLSEHEDFCIPLVKAMESNIPVFYAPKTGVKETMGKSGVCLNTEDPFEIAEVLSTCLNQTKAVNAILESQRARLVDLANQHNSTRVQELLIHWLKKIRTTPNLQMNRRGISHFINV